MADIDGPRLEPASGKADALVVLLHGYGANGEDLLEQVGAVVPAPGVQAGGARV